MSIPDISEKAQRRASRKAVKVAKEKRASPLIPKTESQKLFLESLDEADQVFAIGGAGTGKTYIASRYAIRKVISNAFYRAVIVRPTIANPAHRLGFLPGGIAEKLEPWMRPIEDAFRAEVPAITIEQFKFQGRIEVVAFEHIRGRTFDDAIVILDEAQNLNLSDLHTFLTRIGERSKLIVCGDTDQCDIPNSGLQAVVDMIDQFDIDADVIEFGPEDVVRSEIAKAWVTAFVKMKK